MEIEMKRIIVWTAASLLAACGEFGNDATMVGGAMPEAADLGATPGGAQDIGAAREMLDNGRLPTVDMLTYQGIFSEHDLGFEDPEPCLAGSALCIEARAGTVDLVRNDGADSHLVQIGFDTGIDPDFVRKPLNLSLAIDVSGSMHGDRIAAVRHALTVLVTKLRPDDRFSLIAFNSGAQVIIEPTAGDRADTLRSAIEELRAGGGTNIGAGLEMSIQRVLRHHSDDALNRVMLFTDMHPNRGMRDGRSFVQVLQEAADDGVGVSSFGVGIQFGADLANQVSEVRGGNYFQLETPEKVRQVFDRDFKLMVTPLAYDVAIALRAPVGYRISDSFGLAGAAIGRCEGLSSESCIGLTVPTLFLKRGGGGIYLRLEAGQAGQGEPDFLCFIDYEDDAGEQVETRASISLAPEAVPSADDTDPSIRIGAQLINTIDGLRALVGNRQDETMIWNALNGLRSEVVALGERGDSLLREAMLLSQAIEVARARGGR